MHKICTIVTVNMTYTRSQNFINTVGGKHGIYTFQVMVVVVVVVVVAFVDVVIIIIFCPH